MTWKYLKPCWLLTSNFSLNVSNDNHNDDDLFDLNLLNENKNFFVKQPSYCCYKNTKSKSNRKKHLKKSDFFFFKKEIQRNILGRIVRHTTEGNCMKY